MAPHIAPDVASVASRSPASVHCKSQQQVNNQVANESIGLAMHVYVCGMRKCVCVCVGVWLGGTYVCVYGWVGVCEIVCVYLCVCVCVCLWPSYENMCQCLACEHLFVYTDTDTHTHTHTHTQFHTHQHVHLEAADWKVLMLSAVRQKKKGSTWKRFCEEVPLQCIFQL